MNSLRWRVRSLPTEVNAYNMARHTSHEWCVNPTIYYITQVR